MSTTTVHRRRWSRRAATLAVAITAGLSTALGSAVVLGPDASAEPSYAVLAAPSGVLPAANRCGTFSYRYTVTPPPGTWALETRVIDPRGNAVSSYDVIGGYSPGGSDATTSFGLCRNNTLPGTFTISGKLSVDDGQGRSDSVKNYPVASSTFTLADSPTSTTTQQKAAKKKAGHKKKNKKRKKHKNRR